MFKINLKIVMLALMMFGQAVLVEAQTQDRDTIWTRTFPYHLQNAVFAPDDQSIYATSDYPSHYVVQYDLQGNIIGEIDTIGGIRLFSEDGRFFWNYWGDKYDAKTFQKLYSFGGGGYNINWDPWNYLIDDKNDIGIAVAGGKVIDEQYRRYYDSSYILFKPSDMSIISWTSYPGKAFMYISAAINPNGTEAAFLIKSTARNSKGNLYTDTARLEIWNLQEFKKIRDVPFENFGYNILLRYSPDGSVLGYQHDRKLTLYSTADYSVAWESQNLGLYNFAWSRDMNNLFLSTGILGMYKFEYLTKNVIHNYSIVISSRFIELDKMGKYILCSGLGIILLDNTITSVSDPFFTKDYKTSLIQNQTNGDITLKIIATQPAIATYTITNTIGETYTKPIRLNLEQGLNQFELSISNLPSGAYFLNITINNHSQNLKFMVVR